MNQSGRSDPSPPLSERSERCGFKVYQDDHLECEEEFVLPTIRDTFEDSRRISMIKPLLTDDLSEDKRWVLD